MISASPIRFQSLKWADISTGNVPESDRLLMVDLAVGVPNRVAVHQNGFGAFFYVPSGDGFAEFEAECAGIGLSEHFVALFREAAAQGFLYATMDSDADPVDGLPFFE